MFVSTVEQYFSAISELEDRLIMVIPVYKRDDRERAKNEMSIELFQLHFLNQQESKSELILNRHESKSQHIYQSFLYHLKAGNINVIIFLSICNPPES